MHAGDRTFLVICRRERPPSLMGPNSIGKYWRNARDRLVWYVEVETDRNLLPVIRERFYDEATARARADELRHGLADGSITPPRRPAIVWRRPAPRW